jgi:hypothetical protein
VDKLCFGAVARTLQPALQKPNSHQAVVGLLLDLVADMAGESQLSPDYAVKPKKVHALWHFKEDVHGDIVALASSEKVIKAMPDAIKRTVVPNLVDTMIDDLTENLRKLIAADKGVSKAKRDDLLALAERDTLEEFLAEVYIYALNRSNIFAPKDAKMEAGADMAVTLGDIERLNEIYSKVRRPEDLSVPPEPNADELTYISALLAAYAEDLNVGELSRAALFGHSKYNQDLRQRRKEYYAAETIRRGTREVFGETDPDQFELLKDETYDGIFDIHSLNYKSGYERLLKVMTHVSTVQINKSPLSKLPEWIGNKEKKGVCHILVNDGVIRWVVRDE